MQIIDPKKISKECKITFIIGNGFDLGLGLKTKYFDVYDGYINNPSSSDIVAKFKQDLKDNLANDYENWSDFEIGMAKYATEFDSEDQLVDCVRDFKQYMVAHLKSENQIFLDMLKGFTNSLSIINELNRSLEFFYDGLTPNIINQFRYITKDAEIIRNYITFNYTHSLEALLSIQATHYKFIENEPIHIHGRLDRDVVLGIDNINQLKGIKYSLTRKGQRAFVKTLFNEEYDRARIEKAQNTISQSSIICIYGFSLGESDQTWVEALANWLREDSNHHMVIYDYDQRTYNTYNYDEIMEVEDAKKSKILNKLGICNETVLDQIHIPVGRDLFNFNFVKVESPYSIIGSLNNYY